MALAHDRDGRAVLSAQHFVRLLELVRRGNDAAICTHELADLPIWTGTSQRSDQIVAGEQTYDAVAINDREILLRAMD